MIKLLLKYCFNGIFEQFNTNLATYTFYLTDQIKKSFVGIN